MRELAITFGPAHLVGILTEPAPQSKIEDAPAMVILNSGILHRPGASRIYVQIARALAAEGITTLRFDFSGIGDSDVRRDAIPIEERFATETSEAIDFLQETTGAERFLVGGLCSGGDGAYWASLRDERIAGVWQIDAFCYRPVGYWVRRFGPKLLDPRAWLNAIRVRLLKAGDRSLDRSEDVFVKPEYRRVFPPREDVEAGLRKLLDRGVSLYFLFTGGFEEYLYGKQHEEAFPDLDLGRRARIRHLPACAHTVTGLEHQAILVEDLRTWSLSVAKHDGVLSATAA
jgi:hypothetical protein